MKRKLKLLLFICLLITCLLCVSGCQSLDKTDSVFYSNKFSQATFEYNQDTNKTKVTFEAALENNTIYDFDTFSIKVNQFYNSTLVSTQTYKYGVGVENGNDYIGTFYFYADGEINSIELVSWQANYNSFWQTYKTWIIICIVALCLATLIYAVVIFAEDLDVDDVVSNFEDFIEDHSALIIILFILVAGGSSYGIFTSHLAPVLIIVGTIIAFIVLGLLVHLVKYIIENVGFSNDYIKVAPTKHTGDSADDDYFDNELENVCDYVKDTEKLSLFTLSQLREYCQEEKLKGYSKLNKTQLVEFISSNNTSRIENNAKPVNPKNNYMQELDSLIGLESVKTQLKRIKAILLKNKELNEKANLHMCFYGNPGTGKTVVARLMANIFYETGILPTNKLIETDRSGLCGQYVGQTAPLTHKKVKEAMGGVLFIDEAYTLNSNASGEDFGQEAIAALLKDMEDYKGKFCVILAGYKDEMEKMIALNPGFDSRINRKIDFPDYSVAEQMQIFDIMLAKKKYEITDDAREKLLEIFELKSKSKNFANARTVRNILDSLIEIQAVRTMDSDAENERIIKIEDAEQYAKEL